MILSSIWFGPAPRGRVPSNVRVRPVERKYFVVRIWLHLLCGCLVLGCAGGQAQSLSTQSWSSAVSPNIPITGQCLGGDFNGDGVTDVACYGSNGNWVLALSTGSSVTSQTWSSGVAPSGSVADQCLAADFNADGRTDIACLSASSSATWSVGLSTGSAFSTQSWGGGSTIAAPLSTNCIPGDFNGDGRADVACYTGSGGSWALWLANGSGFTTQFWPSGLAPSSAANQLCLGGDFNGDGRTDLVCYSGSGSWSVALSTGGGFSTQVWSTSVSPNAPIGAQCVTGDFNGDGRMDLACYTGSNGVWAMGLSSGSSLSSQFWSSNVAPTAAVSQRCITGDFNGDGLTDIACYTGSGGGWSVGYMTGAGIVSQSWSSGLNPPTPIANQCLVGDVNGDGLTDLVCYMGSAGTWQVGIASPSAM